MSFKLSYLLISTLIIMSNCNATKHIKDQQKTEKLTLEENETNAVFLGINHVNIFRIKGMEFYHMYLVIIVKNPDELGNKYASRQDKFYSTLSKHLPEEQVLYYDHLLPKDVHLWETTISASSTCAYDTSETKLGKLIKVPNYDRRENDKSSKNVLLKKIAFNDIEIIKKILEFENLYDNSLKYALVPELKKEGYNSNSFTRGALEYAGLMDKLEIPSCFKTPGISKSVRLIKPMSKTLIANKYRP